MKTTTKLCAIPLALAAAGCSQAKAEKEPVNILWLFGEDISPWMGPWGDSTVQTPNVDFLVENGVLFTNCYATCSVSSPTRSALVTGMMQTTINAHNHRTARTDKLIYNLPEGIKVLPQFFREKGYHTFNLGKDDFNWHYDWNDYWTGPHEQKGFYDKFGTGGGWQDRAEGQPFFGEIELFGGKNHGKVKDGVKLKDIKVPPYYPDNLATRKQMATHYNQIKLTDIEIGNVIEKMKQDGIYENTIIVFLSDNGYQMLRDKQFLYDGGIRMPLVISAPGNPKLLTDRGITKGTRDDLVSLIDLNATTLAMAGIEIPDYMEAKDVFAKDYHRDFIVAARDRCDFTIDRIRAIRTKEFKYIRNFMTDRPLMQPQYRDNSPWCIEFKRVWKEGKVKFADDWLKDYRPAEELYDIVNDPYEINNLAKDPKYKEELKKMRGYLTNWIKETDDKGQYPEPQKELEIVYQRWGDRCVNPEYDQVKKYMKVDTSDVERYKLNAKAKALAEKKKKAQQQKKK